MQSVDFVSYDEQMFEHVCEILAEVPAPPGYLKALPTADPEQRLIIVRGDNTVWDEKKVDAVIKSWEGGEIPLALLIDPIDTIDVSPADKSLQIWDDKSMFYLHGDMELSEFELTEPIEDRRGGDGPTNLVGLSVCYIECLTDDMFIRWIEYLARRLPVPSWVHDSNNVLWPALGIDPDQLVL
jgi:hypothetical protein